MSVENITLYLYAIKMPYFQNLTNINKKNITLTNEAKIHD